MLCVLFICVLLWEKWTLESRWVVFSLTELTDLTEHYSAQFQTHRRPSAYREHRGLTPNPSPNGEGSSMWGYPYRPTDRWKKCSFRTPSVQGYLGDYSPLHSERGWGWGWKGVFFVREHALLACRRRPSWGKKGVFYSAVCNSLICWLLWVW